jgi:hypothetical protein
VVLFSGCSGAGSQLTQQLTRIRMIWIQLQLSKNRPFCILPMLQMEQTSGALEVETQRLRLCLKSLFEAG